MTPEQLEQILPLLIGTILIEGAALTILSYLVLKSRGEPPVIEEVFVIYKDGRLISHVSTVPYTDSDEVPDEDIFTGMLTVVQTFIEDSFHSRDETDLKKLEFGQKSIYFKAGKYLNLAVVFTGDATDKMSAGIAGTLNTIEQDYLGSLKNWDGELQKLRGIEDLVKPLLGRHARR